MRTKKSRYFFVECIYIFIGDDMLYTAAITKKTRLFQKAYTIDGNMIYITDTKRAKQKFLKSGIKNLVFNSDVSCDEVFGSMVRKAQGYSEAFLLNYAEAMLIELCTFLKLALPVNTILISDKKMLPIALKYAKTIVIWGDGEDYVVDGANVLYTKRLRRMPDAAMVCEGSYPMLWGVPTVDISKIAKSSQKTITSQTLCFKCDLLPYEISAESLMYLLDCYGAFDYHLTSYRKKLPPLFTFC